MLDGNLLLSHWSIEDIQPCDWLHDGAALQTGVHQAQAQGSVGDHALDSGEKCPAEMESVVREERGGGHSRG